MHVDARLDQVGGHQVCARTGVLVHEASRIGDQADIQRLGDIHRGLHPQSVHQVPDDLRGAGSLGNDEVDGAEVRVVVMMVDVEDVHPSDPEGLGGVALEIAAIQEHRCALADVVGRCVDQSGEREEAVLGRQRQIARGDEHQRVLAERRENPLHRDQRAERVPIWVLVGDDDQLLSGAKLVEGLFATRLLTVLSHLPLRAPARPAAP